MKKCLRKRFAGRFMEPREGEGDDTGFVRAFGDSCLTYIEETIMRFYHFGMGRSRGSTSGSSEGSATPGGGATATTDDLLAHMTFTVDYMLKHTRVETAVMLFDKPEHVPVIKGRVQDSRDGDRRKRLTTSGRAPMEWDGRSRILTWGLTAEGAEEAKEKAGAGDGSEETGDGGDEENWDATWTVSGTAMQKTLPDWECLLANRGAARQALRELMELLRANMEVPRGKRVIIDGPFDDVPYVIDDDGRRHDPRFANRIGESEIRAAWYIANMPNWGMPGDVMLYSTDTDALVNCIYNARDRATAPLVPCRNRSETDARAMFRNNVYIYNGRMMNGCSADGTTATGGGGGGAAAAGKRPEFIDLNGLTLDLVDAMREDTRLPCESFAAVCIWSGNDYTDGFYGLTTTCMVETYLDEGGGDVVTLSAETGMVEPDVGGLMALLGRCMTNAYYKRRPAVRKAVREGAPPPKGYRRARLGLDEVARLLAAKRDDDTATRGDLVARCKRLTWILTYMRSPTPSAFLPYHEYGYRLVEGGRIRQQWELV